MFLFRLARELRYTVRELLERLDSRELTEWAALYRLEAKEREQREKERKAEAESRRWRR